MRKAWCIAILSLHKVQLGRLWMVIYNEVLWLNSLLSCAFSQHFKKSVKNIFRFISVKFMNVLMIIISEHFEHWVTFIQLFYLASVLLCCLKLSYKQFERSYSHISKKHGQNFINLTNVFLFIGQLLELLCVWCSPFRRATFLK